MGLAARAPKRIKVRTISKASTPKPRKAKGITSLTKPRSDGSEPDVAVSNTQARMGFRCPVTIDTVFDAPAEAQVAQFYNSRSPGGASFSQLPRAVNIDTAVLNKKIEEGRMLDPRDAKSIELMRGMLKGLSVQVWIPLKRLIGEALGSSMEDPPACMQISRGEEETLYNHLVKSGAMYTDIANLYTLLLLSYFLQHSKVLRDSTVDEFVLVPEGTHYRLVFRGCPCQGALVLTPDQSMIVRFIARLGHRFCKVNDMEDDSRRLLLNSKGQNWTQADIGSRFRQIGAQWPGLQKFSQHDCRSFFAAHALNHGQMSPANGANTVVNEGGR